MKNDVTLGVYRIQDIPYEGMPKDFPRLVELHNLRGEALHDVFDMQQITEVISWGNTDDTTSHEYVEILLSAISASVIQPLLIQGLKELGKKLAEKAIDETTSEFVKWIISKLIKKQKDQKILDFNIKLKDGTFLRIDPPQGKSDVTIHFNDGEVTSIKYKFDKK